MRDREPTLEERIRQLEGLLVRIGGNLRGFADERRYDPHIGRYDEEKLLSLIDEIVRDIRDTLPLRLS